MEHQLAGWAPSTSSTQGEEHVFLVSHKYQAVSWPCPWQGEEGGHVLRAVPGRPEQKGVCVCVCVCV